MNGYFVNITQTIRQKQFQFDRGNNPSENHTGIQNHSKIKSNLGNVLGKFDFKKVHEKEVKREIMNLNSKKGQCHGAIRAKFLNNL